MSRIGKKPIAIPQGVTVKLEDSKIVITGPIGTLEQALPEQVTVKIEDNNIIVERNNE
ncbi:TPA: 50S ribosomal protein L6, partial [bacterium]|nr:50S ribosomal protein L6 [bacterium]